MSHHSLPEAALDGDIAILGRKGGGKTVTAKGIVEHLLTLGRRVLIFDPLGGWWGLRSSPDGDEPGFKVAVIGGDHGDYPLAPGIAEPLADLIARNNLPCIIDIADAKADAQRVFLLALLQKLKRVNRDPLTVVLEEADVFAPQSPSRDLTKELHDEIDWLARRGRARGFRLITICQRPARLSKDVLTQAQTLIAHVLPSPQDRDAVKAWVEGNGDREAAREVFDTLGKLPVGEAWTWVTDPQHGFLRRVKYPMITTFDSTRTPRAGELRIEPTTLAQVDMRAIEKALRKDNKAGASATQPHDPARSRAEYDRGYREGHEAGRRDAEEREIAILERLRDLVPQMGDAIADAVDVHKGLSGLISNSPGTPSPQPTARVADTTASTTPRRAKANGGDTSIDAPTQRILDAIAWWAALGVKTPSRTRVAFMARYKPSSGSFRTYLSRMKASGLITMANNTLQITDKGRPFAGEQQNVSFRNAVAIVRDQLSEPVQRIFDHCVSSYPAAVPLKTLASRCGYEFSGSFRTYLSRARALEIVTKDPDTGGVRAAAFLFGASNGR